MKKYLASILLITSFVLVLTACPAGMVKTIEQYVDQFLPLAVTITDLVLATEAPDVVATAKPIEDEVVADIQQIRALADSINDQNYADKRAAILALADTTQQRLAGLLAAAHIKNPATAMKIQAFVNLGNAIIKQVINSLPPPNQAPSQVRMARVQTAKVMADYKTRYNALLATPSGDPKVDAVLAKQKRL